MPVGLVLLVVTLRILSRVWVVLAVMLPVTFDHGVPLVLCLDVFSVVDSLTVLLVAALLEGCVVVAFVLFRCLVLFDVGVGTITE